MPKYNNKTKPKNYDKSWMYEPMVDVGEFEAVQLQEWEGKWYLAERYRPGEQGVFKKWMLPAMWTKDSPPRLVPKSGEKGRTIQVPLGMSLDEAEFTLTTILDGIKKKKEGKWDGTSNVEPVVSDS